jgi:putative nucleotidyltransferase-like protein
VAGEISEALARVGIRSILVRGPSLTRWVYPPDRARSYLDVDLLIAPGSFAAAERTIAALGFEHVPTLNQDPRDRPIHARTWQRPGDGAVLDLHHTLIGARVDEREVWAALEGATEPLVLGTGTVEALDAPATALVVALHAAQHGRRSSSPLADLEQALERLDPEIWREAGRLAGAIDAMEAFAAGLRLASAGRELAAALRLPEGRTAETVIRAATPIPTALGFEWLAQVPGIRAKGRLLAAKLVPGPEFMRAWSPLARRGRVGLALAYVQRPLWLARHTPAGFREWRRARREARR